MEASEFINVLIFCYLLESTELCGGVRVVFDQARGLLKCGHHVIIRAKRGCHQWYHHPIEIEYVNDLAEPFKQLVRPDIIFATFWTTVESAIALECSKTYHLCQGYEGDIVEYAAIKGEIEAVYRLPIAKLTIGDWLTKRLQIVFGTQQFDVYTIGQIVDTTLFVPSFFSIRRLWRQVMLRPARVLLVGQFENNVKGIATGLYAVQLLRKQGVQLHLTRVSTQPIIDKEADITDINSYFYNVRPPVMTTLYQNHDVLLAPSLENEGFGLPFAEALSCGLPCVATRISSYLSFDQRHDYASFVSPSNAKEMAQATLNLINNHQQQNKQHYQGVKLMPKLFSETAVIKRIEIICSN